MEQVIFARHGESEYSVRSALNGDITVPCGLTPAGRAQALALGEMLADVSLDLCVTTAFQRTRETADLALQAHAVPREVVPDLNDPLLGPYEGCLHPDYRVWLVDAPSAERPGPGGESRQDIFTRYARGFRWLLDRIETTVLVVAHSLPIAVALAGREGIEPTPRARMVEYATPLLFTAAELDASASVLEQWLAAPTW